MRIVLASASPRRSQLLASLGCRFEVIPTDIDESSLADEEPTAYVLRVANEKAAAFPARANDLVIAADTTVDVDGEILAKPLDEADARRMLGLLSGRTHQVHTAIAVRFGAVTVSEVDSTAVRVADLSAEIIDWYLSTGEPFDKAGAYALQGSGAVLIEGVNGSVSNVIGLSLTLLDDLVRRLLGASLWSQRGE